MWVSRRIRFLPMRPPGWMRTICGLSFRPSSMCLKWFLWSLCFCVLAPASAAWAYPVPHITPTSPYQWYPGYRTDYYRAQFHASETVFASSVADGLVDHLDDTEVVRLNITNWMILGIEEESCTHWGLVRGSYSGISTLGNFVVDAPAPPMLEKWGSLLFVGTVYTALDQTDSSTIGVYWGLTGHSIYGSSAYRWACSCPTELDGACKGEGLYNFEDIEPPTADVPEESTDVTDGIDDPDRVLSVEGEERAHRFAVEELLRDIVGVLREIRDLLGGDARTPGLHYVEPAPLAVTTTILGPGWPFTDLHAGDLTELVCADEYTENGRRIREWCVPVPVNLAPAILGLLALYVIQWVLKLTPFIG